MAHSPDIHGFLDLQAAIDAGNPRVVAHVAREIAREFSAAGIDHAAADVLSEAFIAIGPGPEAAMERLLVGDMLFRAEMALGNLDAAWGTASRIVLAPGGAKGWVMIQRVCAAYEHEGRGAEAVGRLELLEALIEGHDSPPWDAADTFGTPAA